MQYVEADAEKSGELLSTVESGADRRFKHHRLDALVYRTVFGGMAAVRYHAGSGEMDRLCGQGSGVELVPSRPTIKVDIAPV